MEGTIGEIRPHGAGYQPENWLFCNGQSLSRKVYADLFKVIGTTFGSENDQSFSLPDCFGRVPIGANEKLPLGTKSGSEYVQLEANNLPEIIATAQIGQIPVYVSGTLNMRGDLSVAVPCDSAGIDYTDTPRNGYVAKCDMDGGGMPVRMFSSEANGKMASFSTQLNMNNIQLPGDLSLDLKYEFGKKLAAETYASTALKIVQPGLLVNYVICAFGARPVFGNEPGTGARIPHIQWTDAPLTDYATYYGKIEIGSSNAKQKVVKVEHDLNLGGNDGTILANIAADGNYKDVFAVNVISDTVLGDSFKAVVTRVDGDSWGQNPVLEWQIIISNL